MKWFALLMLMVVWSDASDSNTIDMAGLPMSQHKVRIELVNANHQIVP